MSDDTGFSYAGFCPDCNRLVAVAADHAGKLASRTRKHVQEFMRDGLTIQRITDEDVRSKKFGWGCTTDCPCKYCVKKRAKLTKADAQLEPTL